MHRWSGRRGFTLIELLVVISVIGVLVAVLFPVFSTAREKARQVKCRNNMMQLVTQLNQYRKDNGHYPDSPQYNTDTDKYHGGFSDLYPEYIEDLNLFICPDDREALKNAQECRDRLYCSYNGIIDWDDIDDDNETWEFRPFSASQQEPRRILYNYYGYAYCSEDDCSKAHGHSNGYETAKPVWPENLKVSDPAYDADKAWMDACDKDGASGANGIPDWLDKPGLSWKHFPRLRNKHAPDTTIVTHCPYHGKFVEAEEHQLDLIVRLSGETSTGYWTTLGAPEETGVPADWAGATPVAGWVHQNF